MLCGLDLAAGGTWFGISESGQVALLTNFAEPVPGPALPDGRERPSRGALVTDFLTDQHLEPASFAADQRGKLEDYAGFNLLVASVNKQKPPPSRFAVLSNRCRDSDAEFGTNRKSTEDSESNVASNIWSGMDAVEGVMSNGHFEADVLNAADAWAKVKAGKRTFEKALREHIYHDDPQRIVNALLRVLTCV